MPVPSIVIHPVPEVQVSPFSLNSPLGGMVFSYAVSALFVCLGMMIGWTWKVWNRSRSPIRISLRPGSSGEEFAISPKIVFVGRSAD